MSPYLTILRHLAQCIGALSAPWMRCHLIITCMQSTIFNNFQSAVNLARGCKLQQAYVENQSSHLPDLPRGVQARVAGACSSIRYCSWPLRSLQLSSLSLKPVSKTRTIDYTAHCSSRRAWFAVSAPCVPAPLQRLSRLRISGHAHGSGVWARKRASVG